MAKSSWPDWDVYVRDNCICVYCGFNGQNIAGWRQLQIDHLIPVSTGGPPKKAKNKVVACTDCNRKKHGFDPSKGDFSLLDSDTGHSLLVEEARQHIDRKRRTEIDDFELMMSEIKSGNR
jgi:hypothetical protein